MSRCCAGLAPQRDDAADDAGVVGAVGVAVVDVFDDVADFVDVGLECVVVGLIYIL